MAKEIENNEIERAFVEDRKIVTRRFIIHSAIGGFKGMINRLRSGKPCKISVAESDDYPEEQIIIVEEK